MIDFNKLYKLKNKNNEIGNHINKFIKNEELWTYWFYAIAPIERKAPLICFMLSSNSNDVVQKGNLCLLICYYDKEEANKDLPNEMELEFKINWNGQIKERTKYKITKEAYWVNMFEVKMEVAIDQENRTFQNIELELF